MAYEDQLRRWATTASEPLPLITQGDVVVEVRTFDGPRADDLRRLADLVAAAREADRTHTAGWDSADADNIWGTTECVAFCEAMNVLRDRLAALDEASGR